jgi:hypothetical protein
MKKLALTAPLIILTALAACAGCAAGRVLDSSGAVTHPDGSVSYAVYSGEAKAYEAGITGDAYSVNVNGAPVADDGGKLLIPLNIGTNIINVSSPEAELTVNGLAAPAEYGADMAYTRYEAEDASHNAALSDDSRAYGTMSAEASGRRYVTLSSADEYITFKLTKPANGFVLRYSIPDSEDGSGSSSAVSFTVNGEVVGVVPLTSRYAWSYGAFPWTNNPADGGAHHFFDDARLLLPQVYGEGTEITVKPVSGGDAISVDLLEAETADAPLPQPEGSLSVADFGGLPDDGEDDTAALSECIAEAGGKGMSVYIPAGEYTLNSPVFPHGIDIRKPVTVSGAGMWHTMLKGEAAAFYMRSSNVTLRDFSLYGDCLYRDDSVYPSAIESDSNQYRLEDFRLYNLWIEHQKVGMWVNTVGSIHMAGCRIRNTYADGLNLRRGSSNCTIEQNDFRNNGDDAIAGWSAVVNNTGNVIRHNTVALPWLANGIALYGGADILVEGNLVSDIVDKGAAVNISTNFDPDEFAGVINVRDNYFLRCGSVGYAPDDLHGAIWFNTVEGTVNPAEVRVEDNVFKDSTYYGVNFSGGGEVTNAVLNRNKYEGQAYPEVDVTAGTKVTIVK